MRGRIRFDDQVRRRFGIPLPVEVRYDEFTDDILANRLVKAAAVRLGRMRLRSPEARRGLRWVAAMLDNVSYEEFSLNNVPDVTFDRLNEHYRGVVTLARLVLRRGAFEADRGMVRASGFLMDMNQVFQEFITVALREALGVSERELCSPREMPRVTLAKGNRVRLEPDLSWWRGGTCVFVGDVKYKRIEDGVESLTCIKCWRIPPRLTCRADYWSMRRTRLTLRHTLIHTRCAAPASGWRWRRWICPARSKTCWNVLRGSRAG